MHLHTLLLLATILGARCGEGDVAGNGQTLISYGKRAVIQDYPWHVGIYRHTEGSNYTLDCGGILITTRHVVTAAHCFWDEKLGQLVSRDLYKIALGKVHRDWLINDPGAKRMDIDDIIIQRSYRGRRGNFQYDIAVVQMALSVELSAYVNVVHVDWLNEHRDDQSEEGINGTVLGWGYTEDDTLSGVLRSVQLPYVSNTDCAKQLDRKVLHLLTADKFCAGYIGRNVSVCPGDSGGGLVVYNQTTGKHYLRGVVSINFRPAHNRDLCYAQHYTAFTMVADPLTLQWVRRNSRLEPGCGERVAVAGQPLVAGGEEAAYGDFPWFAGLYKFKRRNKYQQQCGGTLITTRHVITAGHCIIDKPRNQEFADTQLYKVALGKYYRSWAIKEPNAQLLDVSKFIKHPKHTAERLLDDIGVIVLATEVKLTGYVNVVCMDWNNQYLSTEMAAGTIGTFAGWGFDEFDEQSEGLHSTQLPIVSAITCIRSEPLFYGQFLSERSFCAGSRNGTTVCRGDSGGGLLLLNQTTDRYFLHGISSIGQAPETGRCEVQSYTIFTLLAAYLDWIKTATGYNATSQDTITARSVDSGMTGDDSRIVFPDDM